MDNINQTTITPPAPATDPSPDAQAHLRRLPETVENLPVRISAYPRAAAWLAAGCPQARRRVYRKPAERSSAVSCCAAATAEA